jgi:DNA-binding transcriptional LysR family regulator
MVFRTSAPGSPLPDLSASTIIANPFFIHDVTAMDWNDLRYFLAVARLHSLTEASRLLRVSQSTVARRIAALEHALKTELFTRRSDGYMLTEAGEALLQPAEQVEAQLLSLERGATMPRDALTGIVRLAVPEFLGQHLIIPGLTELQKRYPMIGLELIADVRPMRLTRREADVLVRLVQPNQGTYLVRRIGGIVLALYGSASYLAAHGMPGTSGELSGHRLIGWESGLGFLPLAQWLQNMAAAPNFAIRAHTMGAQLAAVEAGLGLAVLPAFVARKYGLIRVLGAEPPFQSDIWLLQEAEAHKLARVRAVVDHVSHVVSQAMPQLESLD